jgi:hypothetical protein
MWHPTRQDQYKLDAMIFLQIALNVALALILQRIDNPEVIEQYQLL